MAVDDLVVGDCGLGLVVEWAADAMAVAAPPRERGGVYRGVFLPYLYEYLTYLHTARVEPAASI